MSRPQPWPTEFSGECIVRRAEDGTHIVKADNAILITPEFLRAAAAGELIGCTLDGNILTLGAVNATVRYWVDNPAPVRLAPLTSIQVVEAKRIPIPVCPECAQEKHPNCVGEALDESTDDIGPCMCSHTAWEDR